MDLKITWFELYKFQNPLFGFKLNHWKLLEFKISNISFDVFIIYEIKFKLPPSKAYQIRFFVNRLWISPKVYSYKK